MPVLPKVLVTGAAGRIGSFFAEHAPRDRYELRLLVGPGDSAEAVERVRGFGEVVAGDITDVERMKQACAGMDTVLHLAANANASQTWDVALPTNVIGTYNVFAAAKGAGVRKIVFASSVHAVSGYALGTQVRSCDPVNPGDLYGVSKCFGEALARYMAEQEGVSAIVLRIGAWFGPGWDISKATEWAEAHMDVFISARDLQQLIEKSIEDERLQFGIFNATGANLLQRLDISDARELLGYVPQDDSLCLMQSTKELRLGEKLLSHNLGDGRQQSGLRNEVGD